MTEETYDEIGFYIGADKSIPNHLWVQLISESFNVSKSVAKEMLQSMYYIRSMLTDVEQR